MLQSEYLENARIHIDDDHAVLLFQFGNTECGVAVPVEFIEWLPTAPDGRVVIVEPTNSYKERNGYE